MTQGTSDRNQGIIFYDGLCMACSAEIAHYRKLKGAENFVFMDIMSPDFKPETYKLDPARVHKFMHVQDRKGQLHEGVDAFIAIWQELPRYQFAARWAQKPAVRTVLNLGYQAFVHLRPYLPRKKQDCSASPYCELPK